LAEYYSQLEEEAEENWMKAERIIKREREREEPHA
jgi:hypothetical protein